MGHFGIIELALLNSNQDPNDSSVHHCNFIRYLFRFLQCLFKCLFLFRFLKKKKPQQQIFSFSGTKHDNMESSKQRET